MDRYYKIPPEWAAKLNITATNPRHPDGWYLAMPPDVIPLITMNGTKDDGTWPTLDEAVAAIGGCIYNTTEALASQRGEKEYMMDVDAVKSEESTVNSEAEPEPEEPESDPVPSEA